MTYEEKIEKVRRLITQVDIDADSGVIRWAVRASRRTVGNIAGSMISSGYRSIWFDGNRVQYHQVLFYFVNGYIPKNGRVIDHIDRNKLNNSISNLRDVSRDENARNTNLSRVSTSGHKGVHFMKSTKKWTAQLYCDGKRNHLGSFQNKEDAIKARKTAEEFYYNKD